MPSSLAAIRVQPSKIRQTEGFSFFSSGPFTSKIACGILPLFVLLFLPINAFGQTKFNLLFNMGALDPSSSATPGTFDKGFFYAGSLGAENPSGVEFRLRFGNYSVTSKNAEDLGKGLNLSVSPLTASVNYHFFKRSNFNLFAGAGVGTYLYSVSESALGTLEDGASFGQSISFGGRYAFNSTFFITAEYEKHFVEKIFFDESSNFNNTIITIGIGVSLSKPDASGEHYRDERKDTAIRGVKKKEPYRYSSDQEALLVEMYQIELEMKSLEKRLKQSSGKIKKSEKGDKKKASDNEVQVLREELEAIKTELHTARFYIDGLEARRYELGLSSFPLSYHYDYLTHYYGQSPWGLHYRSGFLFYGNNQYRNRFRHSGNGKRLTQEEKVEIQQKKKDELLRLKKRRF